MLYGFRKIGVVATIPTPGTKPGEGDAADAYRAELGSVLEITARGDGAQAGTLTLLRWFPPPQSDVTSTINAAGEWRPWAEDRPIRLPAGDALVSGRYEQADDSIEHYLLLGSDENHDTTVVADAQCVYYRGRK